jgi:hypothetical protein
MSRHARRSPVPDYLWGFLKLAAALLSTITVILGGVLGAVAAWGFHPLLPLGGWGAAGLWLVATSFLLFALHLILSHLGGK